MSLCPFCGWGDHLKPFGQTCSDWNTAAGCQINRENLRKYHRSHPDDMDVMVVRSIRYQGKDGKGDSSETLEKVLP